MPDKTEHIRFQKQLTIVGIILFIAKIFAWQLTNSVAVLTDALESIVNVIAGIMGWYSLYLSSKPRDSNHPYGHGKVEFVTAGLEGGLILFAGIGIVYEAVINFKNPHQIQKLDIGLLIISISAIANYAMGFYAIKLGNRKNSLPLISSGKHLQSDTYSTIGIIIGLLVLKFTGLLWLDSAIAISFALLIIYTGWQIIRAAIAGIMDEADTNLLSKIIDVLEKNRSVNWIDLHNLRIIKYGSILHIDAHLTLPWYYTINEGHHEVDKFDLLIKENFGDSVEMFIHTDGCLEFSCKICNKQNCAARKHPFQKSIQWNLENVLSNEKQRLPL
jgi:cation diffusion facilitator family transporter